MIFKIASSSVPKAISATTTGVRLLVRAKPGAKRANIVSIDDEAVGVAINAPPREGAANQALVEYLSDCIGVKRSKTTLEAGNKSKSKVVDVETDQSTAEVFAKLTKIMDDSD